MIRAPFVAAMVVALLGACAPSLPSGSPGSTAPPAVSASPGPAPGGRDARPTACVGENQSCGPDARCCAGTVCLPTGHRFGDLCRRPMPASGR